ncbi:lysine-specific histone demethylase 2-like isoform X1 [Ostrea edulis]|uniref:lysine-specific histone demethylase 2-like isoform X1 n=1 Tax=Ostrea edulis TaxID=37623 RepID=UPI0024AED192|nr:lysine-specific histone demethylase 2-like isoform X1 [Ostrea edulis]
MSSPSVLLGGRRNAKRKTLDNSEQAADPAYKNIRRCPHSGCPTKVPICFAGATERCAGSGYTSRWYHTSAAEHYCNECFEHYYRCHKDGYEVYLAWKKLWSTHGTTDASIRMFMTNSVLPFWVQCTDCHKWRQWSKSSTPIPEFLKNYVCGTMASGKKSKLENPCDVPEDQRVGLTRDPSWTHLMSSLSYMKNSPAWPYLTSYFPDKLGMCPSDHEVFKERKTPVMHQYLMPFVEADSPEIASSVAPDVMEELEMDEFPEYSTIPSMYLAIRNICLTLWNLNFKQWLTKEWCATQIICRGLGRLMYIESLDKILWYLTRRGLINVGLLNIPKSPQSTYISNKFIKPNLSVIVIGAGTAGLTAAKQLQGLGVKVTILEARSEIGGRVCDDESLGVCVAKGAQILNGAVNNPITIICEQAGIPVMKLSDRCKLISEKGEVVDQQIDSRMDFHFNAILDIIAEWRKGRELDQDASLLTKLKEMHQQFLDESQLSFTSEEESLMNFHICNLEYACGDNLKNVSAIHWDQNEDYPQFSGDNLVICDGYSRVLSKLAEGLDIEFETRVMKVDYSEETITVFSESGKQWKADKVLVTLPLAVLQEGDLEFVPTLPEWKSKAMMSLGVGKVEKIILRFSRPFWRNKVKDCKAFGHIPEDLDNRGYFNVFYDFSTEEVEKMYLLVTHLTGNALKLRDRLDRDIVAACMEVLKMLFPEETVPKPLDYFITKWTKDPLSKMSYSYIPIGVDGDAYDIMSQDVASKVFFAGEATNRQFPQSVTGAYMSGVREAHKIFSVLVEDDT